MYLAQVAVLLAVVVTATAQTTCDPVVGEHLLCACKMSDGSGTVDLSSYGEGSNGYKFHANTDDRDYYYNLCFPLVIQDGDNCKDQTAGGCQVDNKVDPPASYNLGAFDSASFSIDGSSGNVLLSYTGGTDGREMLVTLMCDNSGGAPQFTALGEPNTPLIYEFTLKAKCACPDGCSGGGGGGGGGGKNHKSSNNPGIVGIVLLVVALFAFVTYFIVGAVFLRVKHQKTGTDLIIHKVFWKDFPFLVKDGVVFTFSPLVKLIRKDKGGYSTFK